MKLITLFLTCADRAEADKIAAKLLDDKLAACVKQAAITSDYLWQGQKQHGDEVLLIIDSAEEKYDAIDSAIKQLHSYDTFVLTAYPVVRSSQGVEKWVKESIS
ncbi:MAG TPA: divalent-cation tolerance protein CutA [Candidatus Saccharimonadales bacterium]|nr:divalent-cation tolerance protein CutA [Candidatus Saccharimonadales bacterium]